jgi:hypothetical protein
MSDWEAKYWQQVQQRVAQKAAQGDGRQQTPHHQGGASPGAPRMPHRAPDPWADVSPGDLMRGLQRAPQEALEAWVPDGVPYYLRIDNHGWGTTVPLVRPAGVTEGLAGKPLRQKGKHRCHVVPEGTQTIDAGKINPLGLIELVALEIPWHGVVLVEATRVISDPGTSPRVLGD